MNFLVNVGKNLTPKNVALGIMACDMIGRPAITMSNTKLPYDTRKTIATREFFTELIGAVLTYATATLVEKNIPAIISKKKYGIELVESLYKKVMESNAMSLSPQNQKIRGIIMLCSFIGTVLAASIMTPLANNFVTNRLYDKLMAKKGDPETQVRINEMPVTIPAKQLSEKQAGMVNHDIQTAYSPSFEKFLRDYTVKKSLNRVI